jgi:hypothetical protein
VWVTATVRSDMWHRLEKVDELRDLAERGARLTLAAPDAALLFDIIRKPAKAAGLTFDTEPGTELTLDAVIAREVEPQRGACAVPGGTALCVASVEPWTLSTSPRGHALRIGVFVLRGRLTPS